MEYTKKKDKYVFNKDGVYFSLTPSQVDELLIDLLEIQKLESPVFRCVVEGKDLPFDTCAWDDDRPSDCVYASQGIKKCDCEYWKAI